MAAMEKQISAGLERTDERLAAEERSVATQMQRMDEHMVALRNTESVNQRLFNSLHQELKEYRDNFLRDSLQKPFIRDLVVLFDDLTHAWPGKCSSGGRGSSERQSAAGQWSRQSRQRDSLSRSKSCIAWR